MSNICQNTPNKNKKICVRISAKNISGRMSEAIPNKMSEIILNKIIKYMEVYYLK